MSFSAEVKQEIAAQRPDKSCCMLSELNALTQCCAAMTLRGRGRVSIAYTTENVSVAKRIFILLKKRLEINATPHFSKEARFGGRRVCVIRLNESDSRKLMLSLHMLSEGAQGEVYRGIPRRALSRRCCRRAFLRGAFLGAGSVTAPEKDYHLEFTCDSEPRAEAIRDMLVKSDIACGMQTRRGAHVVYVKRGELIASALGLMGAVRAMMRLENILAQRSLRAGVLRATNCDHNNMARQLTAARRQVNAITRISLERGLPSLPEPLAQLARLRLANPDATLEQLGEMLTPPLGKSGVNHRLRKIMEIAEAMQAPQGEQTNDYHQTALRT